MHTHSIRSTDILWYRVRPPFAFRTAWILRRIPQGVGKVPQGCWFMLTRWHHAVAADRTAVHSCCEQPVSFQPKDVLLGWGLGLTRTLKMNWTRCHVPGDVHSSLVQCWWSRAHWSSFFLFLADRSGTRCGRLLQLPIRDKDWVVRSLMPFCIPLLYWAS